MAEQVSTTDRRMHATTISVDTTMSPT